MRVGRRGRETGDSSGAGPRDYCVTQMVTVLPAGAEPPASGHWL